MQLQKLMRVGLWCLLFAVISGCQFLPSADVETVVTEKGLRYWELSPDGNRLVYGGNWEDENFLVDLSTRQHYKFDCSLRWWDSSHVGCYRIGELSVLDIDSLVETPLDKIDATKVTDVQLNEILGKSVSIYRPEGVTDTVYILADDYKMNVEAKNYLITGISDPDAFLGKNRYITVTNSFSGCPQDALDEKSISPNGIYYYTTTNRGTAQITIIVLNINDNEKISTFTTGEAEFIECGGWAGDSSGVFFRVHGVGFNSVSVPAEIKKLKVPVK